MPATSERSRMIPTAGMGDTAAVMGRVVVPTVAKGAIIRRPRMVAMAERLDLDRRAVRAMQRLRKVYGRGPLLLRLPAWRQALILDPEDARRVLDETPDPFSTASTEKRAALSHFEPRNALISTGAPRAERRRFNDEVLDSACPMHRLAAAFVDVVDSEVRLLLGDVPPGGTLTWDRFIESWYRIVRRVVLGPGARDDHELTDLLATLRGDANWAFFHPGRKGTRDAFFRRLNDHLARAEPGSLAAVIASSPKTEVTAPDHQVPQWLFAFDPAGMAAFRALGLLAAHRDHADAARNEARERGRANEPLPLLRAAVLESLRLWPTTPMILRQTTADTDWPTGRMPAGTGVLIYAPFFHRDDENLEFADRFAPEIWTAGDGGASRRWSLVPFSAGPAFCPGTHLVLLVTSAALAAILVERTPRPGDPARLDPAGPLPGTLDNYTLRVRLE